MKSKVSLIKGKSRYDINYDSFKAIEEDIKKSLIGKKRIIIKPNLGEANCQIGATYSEHVRAILDFLKERFSGEIIIAESVGYAGEEGQWYTDDCFRNYGYYDLIKDYGVKLLDLNRDEYEILHLMDLKLEKPKTIRVSRTILDPDNYIISAARLKTHGGTLVTLSYKNIAMGAILKYDKALIHSDGFAGVNLNLLLLSFRLRPDLASIDGYDGMQGYGPWQGEPVNAPGVAIASTDFLAADRIGTEVMGFNFEDAVYLNYIADAGFGEAKLENIEIIGEKLKDCVHKFDFPYIIDEKFKYCGEMKVCKDSKSVITNYNKEAM